jgi:hypothetical protein
MPGIIYLKTLLKERMGQIPLRAALAIGVVALLMAAWHGAKPAPPAANTAPHAAAPGAGRPSWFDALGGERRGVPERKATLVERIDTLVASGKPEDAFEAFHLVNSCIWFEKLGTLPFLNFPNTREMNQEEKHDEAALCGGMTERIKSTRLEHLAVAARAGVDGADTMFVEVGPFGDPSALEARPDDPLVLAWKKQALEQLTAAAERANVGSLMMLTAAYTGTGALVDGNPLLAYGYAAALCHIFNTMGQNGAPVSVDCLKAMKGGLTPEQIGAGDVISARVFERYRANRQQVR